MASGPRNVTPTPGGSLDFVHYCPAWTDPNWQDEGPERDASLFDIKDSVFDRLRPALLPRDHFKKPTIYAQRFGIFPGRTDGRSRTSPTRAESREIFPASSDIRNGKELFGRFEDLAKAANEHVDDYMERTRPDMKKLGETEQRFMQQYEDLVIDENWQTILFGSLTMDELQAEGYFSMCDTRFDSLRGQVSELFKRERWVDTSYHGKTADEPRLIYTLNGRREEWNARTNDRVWSAMQPAIQLASRLLGMDDTFISSLLDITNRLWISPRLFQHQPGQDRDNKIRFVPDLDPDDPSRLDGAKAVIDSGIDPRAATWQALLQTIEIELTSGFLFEGKQQRDHCTGVTHSCTTYPRGYNLLVTIDCELVWPLINDTYSNSEKLKASLILATTIAHEMMHACASIPVKWLADPATVGIARGDQVQACSELLHSLQDHTHGDLHGEPYFDEDPYQEVGHAFEEHVMGGGYWSFATDVCILRPALLQTAAGLVAFSQNSDGDINVPPVLQYPPTRNIRLTHYIRTEDVQKYFTQPFWDVAMQKYGTAALRESSKRPHKVTYYPADDAYDTYGFDENTLGTPEDKDWVQDFMKELDGRGNVVLRSYLNNLINEACDFDLMNEQFSTDMITWGHRDQIWRDISREILMILCEISAHTYQASQDQAQDNILDFLHNLWQVAKCQRGRYPDPHSASLDTLSSDPEDWAQHTRYSGLEVYEKRLVPRLIDFTRRVERELMHIESMVCELYQSGTSSWPLYQHFGKGHDEELRDRVDRMIEHITDLLTPVGIADRGIKSIDAEWFNRIWNLGRRVKDVRRLLDLDTQNYEHNWRDLLLSMPMARKSNRKPHQRFYFLAKKEMMKLTGSQLEKMKEFKTRFQKALSLGSYKVVIPGEDPNVLSIAQRLSGTLDDDRGSNDHEKGIKGPSTGIFDIEAVKKLVHQLREEENAAQTDMLNRITNRLKSEAPTLKEAAAEQAGMVPPVPPKFQQMGFENQAVPLNSLEEFKANNAPFSAFSSGTSSPFPQHQPNQPPAWIANSTGDLAAWVNNRLAGGPPVAHGITPHPYALRENLTVDLQNMAQASLPMRNPASFANEYPREVVQDQDSSFVVGPLGDIAQAWEKQYQLGQSPPPAATGGTPVVQSSTAPTRRDSRDIDLTGGLNQGRKATVLSHFDHSSSETDVSDDEAQRTREISSSGTTLVGLSDVEEELLSKIASFERSEARENGHELKRRSSWVPLHSKKKKLETPKARRHVYKSKPKKPSVPRA
ncbi:hypothetical protein ACKRZS_013525 [Fusarium odoratissimum]|uniref:Uncharacterized protein n=1 Tax=Fusarium odoratissimum (strain NRRL 54006) TaxID=1089451 RepID=X0LA22_FUSO5|nr:uncharacterized protein FOIG_04215 [Fusarium odoratissimum NRRL 54006]EXM05710.1 hypothetical protein FOIG_04215 [Fusarium odoratissimum NRRL 54006]KAK2126012.1 hypothetical protein NOF04DRAFT_17194 [Fusarium oxysporum II5]